MRQDIPLQAISREKQKVKKVIYDHVNEETHFQHTYEPGISHLNFCEEEMAAERMLQLYSSASLIGENSLSGGDHGSQASLQKVTKKQLLREIRMNQQQIEQAYESPTRNDTRSFTKKNNAAAPLIITPWDSNEEALGGVKQRFIEILDDVSSGGGRYKKKSTSSLIGVSKKYPGIKARRMGAIRVPSIENNDYGVYNDAGLPDPHIPQPRTTTAQILRNLSNHSKMKEPLQMNSRFISMSKDGDILLSKQKALGPARSQKLRLGRIQHSSIDDVKFCENMRPLSVISCVTKEEVVIGEQAIEKYTNTFKSKEYFELRNKAARLKSLPNIRLKTNDIQQQLKEMRKQIHSKVNKGGLDPSDAINGQHIENPQQKSIPIQQNDNEFTALECKALTKPVKHLHYLNKRVHNSNLCEPYFINQETGVENKAKKPRQLSLVDPPLIPTKEYLSHQQRVQDFVKHMHDLLTQGGNRLIMNKKAFKGLVERYYPDGSLLQKYTCEQLMSMVSQYRANQLLNIGINFKFGSNIDFKNQGKVKRGLSQESESPIKYHQQKTKSSQDVADYYAVPSKEETFQQHRHMTEEEKIVQSYIFDPSQGSTSSNSILYNRAGRHSTLGSKARFKMILEELQKRKELQPPSPDPISLFSKANLEQQSVHDFENAKLRVLMQSVKEKGVSKLPKRELDDFQRQLQEMIRLDSNLDQYQYE
ncbi:hypothetical protein FGO68_gene11778 [Halteria grandinella]|uniref:Uncharacterized protein n=1 Tax=Halteria grandinella TaxID=5974 RepID=A0A8J8T4T0_HALGN|nr:hypothetical protein FGO68_gene11778 [Halteria grandinella]